MTLVTEDTLEQQTIKWFEEIGFSYVFGPDISTDGPAPERNSYSDSDKTRNERQIASDKFYQEYLKTEEGMK